MKSNLYAVDAGKGPLSGISGENVGPGFFYRIVTWSTALAFAFAGASIESLRSTRDGFTFHISVATFGAAVVGGGLSLLYWKLAARNRKAARLANIFLALAMMGLFLYPLRFVPVAKLPDIAIGLFVAACAISTGAFMLYKFGRFLETDSREAESKE